MVLCLVLAMRRNHAFQPRMTHRHLYLRQHKQSRMLRGYKNVYPRRHPSSWTQLTHRPQKRENEDDRNYSSSSLSAVLYHAVQKFQARPATYLLIPCVAALVGWLTNWLAVQMIFYPIRFRGIPLWVKEEVPLGLLGWQGIVPCKTRPMSDAMVHMVTSQLLSVKEAFSRLDPAAMANLLQPEVPQLTNEILPRVLPWAANLPQAVTQAVTKPFTFGFLKSLVVDMQQNIESVFDIRNCVVSQMIQDRSKLGQLFWICGAKELNFLTNSGLWFGFLLGIIQMMVALVWENPWTLSIGGFIVGMATNWLALKWIFCPVEPLQIGPFTLQGMFLTRQKEVAREFSSFFANEILNAEQLWKSVLNNPLTKPKFVTLFSHHFQAFLNKAMLGFSFMLSGETLQRATEEAVSALPKHVPVLYKYMDKTLDLQDTLRVKMEQMSSHQFERVLHPVCVFLVQ